MDCSLPLESDVKVKVAQPVILQARILEWVAYPFSRGSAQPSTGVGCYFLLQEIFPPQGLNLHPSALVGRFFTTEPRGEPLVS